MREDIDAALAAFQSGDIARAESIVSILLRRNSNDVDVLQILGGIHTRRGKIRAALEAYLKANRIRSGQPALLNTIGLLFHKHGDLAQAKKAFSHALQLAPNFVQAQYNLGAVHVDLGEPSEARKQFEAAAAAEPPNAEALARFARFLGQSDTTTELTQTYARRALDLDPDNATALLALCEFDMRRGEESSVIERVKRVLTRHVDNANYSLLRNMLARAYEKKGEYDRAFSEFTTANELQLRQHSDFDGGAESVLAPTHVERLIDYFSSAQPATWTEHKNLSNRAPAFLLGFPRSGTTLTGQILSAHPGITVIEEEEILTDAWTDFILRSDDFERFSALTRVEVEHYRTAYWRRAGLHISGDDPRRIIVDKMPLNTALLGIIFRIFPDAKVIFVTRDPRDAVLSCFQQAFAINTAMRQFLTLNTAGEYYDRVMTLGMHYRERLPLDIHDVRYESMTESLEAEVRPILDFLGVAWFDGMRDYFEIAPNRTVRNPSAKQVTKAPYSTSVGKWRRYECHMQSVLPILNKWAAHFGYDVRQS